MDRIMGGIPSKIIKIDNSHFDIMPIGFDERHGIVALSDYAIQELSEIAKKNEMVFIEMDDSSNIHISRSGWSIL